MSYEQKTPACFILRNAALALALLAVVMGVTAGCVTLPERAADGPLAAPVLEDMFGRTVKR